jgi:hypothetical protein
MGNSGRKRNSERNRTLGIMRGKMCCDIERDAEKKSIFAFGPKLPCEPTTSDVCSLG